MHLLKNIPSEAEIPPIDNLLFNRPTCWSGLSIRWLTNTAPEVVFVHQFAAWGSDAPVEMFLFGARYDLSEVELEGTTLGPGHFVEYIVASRRERSEWSVCRLLQHASPTFSDRSEKGDYIFAREMSNIAVLSVARPPSWDVSEAIWPTIGSKPMLFIGQVTLPDTPITREHLTWDVSVYLFWNRLEDTDRFKVVEQAHGQTAEDHYTTE